MSHSQPSIVISVCLISAWIGYKSYFYYDTRFSAWEEEQTSFNDFIALNTEELETILPFPTLTVNTSTDS